MTADRSVTIRLRVSSAEFDAAMARAGVSVEALAAEVRAAGRDAGSGSKGIDELGRAADRAHKPVGALSTALLILGPALVPIAAVGAGALLGLGAAAGTALIGVLGIRDAIKEGTPLGLQYKQAFAPVVSEFDHLKQVSAQSMFAGINSGAKSAHELFPQLNRDVSIYSGQLGQIVGHTAPGLVALFGQMDPLFRTIGDDLDQGSAKFEHWARSSDGVKGFVAYVQTALPQVESTLGSLTTTVSHVAQGFAPFGSTILQEIRLVSGAINSIPVGTLQVVVPLLAGTALGFKGLRAAGNAADSLAGFATKTEQAGGTAKATSGLVRGLGKAVGYLGPVGLAAGVGLGALSVVMGHSQKAAAEATQRVNEYTHAIENNKVAQTSLTLLQQTGALKAGKDLGFTQDQLIKSVTNQGGAYTKTTAQLASMSAEYIRLDDIHQKFLASGAQDADLTSEQFDRYEKLGAQIPKVSQTVSDLYTAYQKAKTAVQEEAKSLGDNALATAIANDSYLKTAKSLGVTGDAYLSAKLAADQQRQSTEQATVQMQLENDAAGLLRQTLDKLNGKALDAADAQNAFDSSLANMGDHVTTTGHKIKFTTTSIHDMSAASVALRGQLNGQIHNLEAVAEANGGLEHATGKARAQLVTMRKQIIDNAVAHGVDRKAVTDYVDSLLKIPKKIPPTKVEIDDAAARKAARELAAYISRFRPIMEVAVHTKGAPNAGAGGHTAQGAQGGTFTGHGFKRYGFGGTVGGGSGPKADDQLAWLSTGEEVTPEPQASKHRAELKAIAADRYASGGTVKPHTVTDREGGAVGIAQMIHYQTPAAVAAMRDLSLAVNAAFKLKGMTAELNAAQQKLGQLRDAAAGLRNDTTQALRAGLNPAQAGADIKTIQAGLRGGRDSANAFTKKIDTLAGRGLNKDYLAELARNGQGATLDALAAASRAQLAGVSRAYAQYETATARAGQVAGRDVYGGAIMAQHKQVDSLLVAQRRQEATIDRLVHAVRLLTHRPVQVKLDGKVLASIMADYNRPGR